MSAQAMTKRVSTWPVAVHQMVRRLLRWGKGLPGLWRLRHRVLNFETLRFPEQAIKAKLSYGPHLWVRPNDPIGRAIFYDGHWELAVISQFAAALRPGDVVLDVGANIGQFAIVAASKVGPTGKVFAIEAGQAAFDILSKNIAENQFTQVKALHLAAWDCDTTLHLGGVREDMLGWGKVQEASTAQTEAVPARRLDQVLAEHGCDRVDIIKIDIEGAEWKAIQGMTGLFDKHPPRQVYCELANNHDNYGSSPLDIVRFFRARGYRALLLEDAGPVPLDDKLFDNVVNVTVLFDRPPSGGA
ncbi:MAG: FkbM family methyltransferase [Gemmatales bacterium]